MPGRKVLAVPAGLFGAVMQLGIRYGADPWEVVDAGPPGADPEDAPSTFGELSALPSGIWRF